VAELPGRFSGRVLRCGEHLVPEAPLGAVLKTVDHTGAAISETQKVQGPAGAAT
jgi:hypothetical protein